MMNTVRLAAGSAGTAVLTLLLLLVQLQADSRALALV
jgi:hypothetical protein